MYQSTYSRIAADGAETTRAVERELLLQSVALMEEAELAGPNSRQAIEAIHMVSRIWCHLIEDLGNSDNQLPKELRARLISIGLFLIRTAEDIRSGTATSFRGMIDITRTIAEGLK